MTAKTAAAVASRSMTESGTMTVSIALPLHKFEASGNPARWLAHCSPAWRDRVWLYLMPMM
jgi:hypothetical protein